MKIPAHLDSVPEQKLAMPYEPKPMMFVYEAVNRGIHPRDLGYVYPETIVVFDQGEEVLLDKYMVSIQSKLEYPSDFLEIGL